MRQIVSVRVCVWGRGHARNGHSVGELLCRATVLLLLLLTTDGQVTLGLLRLLACCKCFETAPASPMTPRLYWLSFLMGISPIINNMSLDMNSVGVYQTSKLCVAVLSYVHCRQQECMPPCCVSIDPEAVVTVRVQCSTAHAACIHLFELSLSM